MAGPRLLESLQAPAFPSAIDERDRQIGRMFATIGLGVVAGLTAAIVLVVALVFVFTIVMAASGHAGAVQDLVARLSVLSRDTHAVLSWSDTVTALALLASVNTPAFIVPVFVAALIGRRAFRLYLTAAARFRWRLLAWGLVLMPLTLLPLFIVGELLEPTGHGAPVLNLAADLPGRLGFVAIAFACLVPAAAAEEILFRGWLLRQSQALFGNVWAALAINGVLFAAMHMNPNLDDSFQLGMMGVAFAYMSIRLGGIEFAIGAHAINNILIVLFFQPLPLTPAQAHPFSLATFLGAFLVPAACFVTTELVLRWPVLRRLTGVDAGGAPLAPAEAFG